MEIQRHLTILNSARDALRREILGTSPRYTIQLLRNRGWNDGEIYEVLLAMLELEYKGNERQMNSIREQIDILETRLYPDTECEDEDADEDDDAESVISTTNRDIMRRIMRNHLSDGYTDTDDDTDNEFQEDNEEDEEQSRIYTFDTPPNFQPEPASPIDFSDDDEDDEDDQDDEEDVSPNEEIEHHENDDPSTDDDVDDDEEPRHTERNNQMTSLPQIQPPTLSQLIQEEQQYQTRPIPPLINNLGPMREFHNISN